MRRNILTAISAFALLVQPIYVAKLKSQPTAQPISNKTYNLLLRICDKADYNRMSGSHDIVGIWTAGKACKEAYHYGASPKYVERYAYANVLMAIYFHGFRRPNPNVARRDSGYGNYQQLLIDAQNFLNRARAEGVNVNSTQNFLNATNSTLKKTPTLTRIDFSDGASCLLDEQPIVDKIAMIDKMNVCKSAVNRRPVPILALRYAESAFFISKTMFLRNRDGLDGLQGAYISRDFFRRASNTGIHDQKMIFLTQNLIDNYETNIHNRRVITAIVVGIGVLAVGAYLSGAGAVSLSSSSSGVVRSGSGSLTLAEASAQAASRQAAETVRFLAWQERMAAAIPVVP
jgi:hypothetical protein